MPAPHAAGTCLASVSIHAFVLLRGALGVHAGAMPVEAGDRDRFYTLLGAATHEDRCHAMKFAVDIVSVVGNMLFFAGSVLLLRAATQILAAELYVGGSLIFVVIGAANLLEQQYSSRCANRGGGLGGDGALSALRIASEGALSEHSVIIEKPGSHEVLLVTAGCEKTLENFSYMLGSIAFAVGSVFYIRVSEKRVYDIDRFGEAEVEEEWGATLFIAGSVAYTLASFFNALTLLPSTLGDSEASAETAVLAFRLGVAKLMCTQLGSVCFVAGSFLYRPALQTDCGHRDDDSMCASAIVQGTWLYIAGTGLFLLQSLLQLTSACVADLSSPRQRRRDDEPKGGADRPVPHPCENPLFYGTEGASNIRRVESAGTWSRAQAAARDAHETDDRGAGGDSTC